MHTFYHRLNALLFHGVTVIFCCAVATNFTVFWDITEPASCKLTAHPPIKFIRFDHPKHTVKADMAQFRFDIDVDLQPLWNWNVKVLFVFVTAEYATPSHPLNQVTIWDHIVTEKSMAVLNKKGVLNKYQLFDHGFNLRGNNITFKLNWYTVPVSGPLFSSTHTTHSMTMPVTYMN
eukprot:TRINITY_DN11118_c0_g1_i4.p1 TRINITY_DN11118_c0_g1~~TRINITY_DN11118_c0_g1_i4.p1  ORF type:complete len:176 (-),score=37.96 TRINITY_DN11118_c0_g1_i4:218-745(-)